MNKIREQRQLLGLSQEELAKILGVERSTVTKWENGDSKPRANMLVKLANVLGCSVDVLLCAKE